MDILLRRVASNNDETVGILYIDGLIVGVTCEDEARNVKVAKETRIPAGKYKLGLRTVGGHHGEYSKRFPAIHKGMLELQNVPKFQFILIHIGNTEEDTDGCILVGEKLYVKSAGRMVIENSTLAYQRIYKQIIDEITAGKEVWIKIDDDK